MLVRLLVSALVVSSLSTAVGSCARAAGGPEHPTLSDEAATPARPRPPAAPAKLSADWPQLHGPTRDGVYRAATDGPHAIDPVRAPTRLWRREIGAGFAGPVATDDTVILFHRVGGEETVEAVDARTGKPRWKSSYPTGYRDRFGFDEGPRATPTIADGRVFTFGAEGSLCAFDLETGKRLWRVDTQERFQPVESFFGAAASPLVIGERVVAHIGGSMRRTVDGTERGTGLVAFDAASGDIAWSGSDDEVSYSSPVLAELDGASRLLAFGRAGLEILDPASGDVLFRKRWRARIAASVNAATPLVHEDTIFLSTSYSVGALTLRAEKGTFRELWSGDGHLTNHYSTSVIVDGVVYGHHGRQESGPSLRAIDLETGKLHWEREGFGAGTLLVVRIASDDGVPRDGSSAATPRNALLAVGESGELVVLAARIDRHEELARHVVLPGVVRAYPALAKGVLYVRNEGELVAVSLLATR